MQHSIYTCSTSETPDVLFCVDKMDHAKKTNMNQDLFPNVSTCDCCPGQSSYNACPNHQGSASPDEFWWQKLHKETSLLRSPWHLEQESTSVFVKVVRQNKLTPRHCTRALYQIHTFTNCKGNSSQSSFFDLSRCAPRNGFPTHADAVRMSAIRPHEDLFASNDHEWKQKQIHELLAFLNFVVIPTLGVANVSDLRQDWTVRNHRSLQCASKWRGLGGSGVRQKVAPAVPSKHPSIQTEMSKPAEKKPETSNSSTTQSRSMIISGRNMGATLALAVSLRVPPPSWVQNSNRLNMQIWGWFSDGSLKLFQFWNCSNLKPQKSVCSATKSWNGDAGNRNCGLTAAIFFTDFCRCF